MQYEVDANVVHTIDWPSGTWSVPADHSQLRRIKPVFTTLTPDTLLAVAQALKNCPGNPVEAVICIKNAKHGRQIGALIWECT